MLPNITIDGRLTADPELNFTASGKGVCSLRVAASDSKKLDDGTWETTEQVFIGVSVWEPAAEAAAETLRRGDRVLITGRIFEREYEKRDGTKGKTLEMKFPTVAKVVEAPRGQRTTSAPTTSAPAADPWAVTPSTDDEPPF